MMAYRLNDQVSFPLINDDSRFQLISTVVRWLEYWRGLPYNQGKLIAQTFSSFQHSCIAPPSLSII